MQEEFKVGDNVTMDGYSYFEVTHVNKEEVKTMSKGTLVFTRLYFGEKHPPVWSYNVKGKK
jgi:hypothetical protein